MDVHVSLVIIECRFSMCSPSEHPTFMLLHPGTLSFQSHQIRLGRRNESKHSLSGDPRGREMRESKKSRCQDKSYSEDLNS